MHLSKKAEYALRSMIHLGIATELGLPTVSGADLAEANRLPLKFVERILQELREAGLVETKRGKLDVITDRFGWIGEDFTPSLKLKVSGHGTKFFWAQMLMGDSADNVRGLSKLDGKAVAEVGTLEFLQAITDENEAANRVLWAYARNGQDALAEAQMLWLRRSHTDCAYRYFSELDLDANLRTWINQLHDYHQAVLQQKLGDSCES